MSKFIDELRRRHVVHTAIGYIVAAYAAVEVALNIVEIYHLSTVWVRYLVVALGIGFIPVTVASWYYEWSSEGLQRDEVADVTRSGRGLRKADYVTGSLLIAALAYIAWDLADTGRPSFKLDTLYPLSTPPGIGYSPAVSRNGSYVAYALFRGDNSDIYVQSIDSADAVGLTDTAYQERTPTWSPDGTRIAFLRLIENERREIVIAPMTGGSERKILDLSWTQYRTGLDWSPDGRFLIFADRVDDGSVESWAIFRLTLATGDVLPLTHPLASPLGTRSHDVPADGLPKVAPDGKRVVFQRYEQETWRLCVVSIDGTRERCLENTRRTEIWSQDWLPDSGTVVFVAEDQYRSNVRTLLQVATKSGEVSRFHDMPTVFHVGVAKQSDRVVVSSFEIDQSIWRIRGPISASAGAAEQITHWEQNERWPHVSPDGSKVVFWTDHEGSGTPEIWVANIDGSEPTKITSDENGNYPRISPDGRQVAYTGALYEDPESQTDEIPINVVDLDGGYARRIVSRGAVPTWSADGDWIYFMADVAASKSCTSGYHLYRQSLTGERQLITDCGIRPIEGPDDRVYFVRRNDSLFSLFSVPIGGGEPRVEVERVNAYFWDLSERHLVYIDEGEDNLLKIRDLATNETRVWAAPFENRNMTPETTTRSLSVSRNGAWIVFTAQSADMDFHKSRLIEIR